MFFFLATSKADRIIETILPNALSHSKRATHSNKQQFRVYSARQHYHSTSIISSKGVKQRVSQCTKSSCLNAVTSRKWYSREKTDGIFFPAQPHQQRSLTAPFHDLRVLLERALNPLSRKFAPLPLWVASSHYQKWLTKMCNSFSLFCC